MNTINKFLILSSVVSILTIPTISQAGESESPISANVSLVTDYYFRGISQTDNDGAIQGGFDWSHDSGLYAGVWASNVDFGDTHIEVDTYIGFANDIGDTGIAYDISALRYNYNDADFETNEFTFALSYSYFSASYSYSDDWYDSDESSNYFSLGFDYNLPYDIALSASVGKSFGEAYEVTGGNDYDYIDYTIGVSKEIYGLSLDLSYVGNNLSRNECNNYEYDHSKGHCDERFILTLSKSF